jgi:hypothetical protein
MPRSTKSRFSRHLATVLQSKAGLLLNVPACCIEIGVDRGLPLLLAADLKLLLDLSTALQLHFIRAVSAYLSA